MLKQDDFLNSGGKTIKAVRQDEYDLVIVSFTDGTFSTLQSCRLGDDTEVETGNPLCFASTTDHVIVSVLGEEGLEAKRSEIAARQEAIDRRGMLAAMEYKDLRRKEYLKLQEEFGGEG